MMFATHQYVATCSVPLVLFGLFGLLFILIVPLGRRHPTTSPTVIDDGESIGDVRYSRICGHALDSIGFVWIERIVDVDNELE